MQLTGSPFSGWWLILGMGACAPAAGLAQRTVTCDGIAVGRDALWPLPESVDPYRNGMPESLVNALRHEAQHDGAEPATVIPGFVAERWRQDSTSTKYALAFLVAVGGYSGLSTTREAHTFATYYKSIRGDPGPLLLMLRYPRDESRTSLVLDATDGPLTPEQSLLVFRLGCDAAWMVDAWRADASPRRPASGSLGFVLQAELVLQQAVRLLPEPYHTNLLERAGAAGLPWAKQR